MDENLNNLTPEELKAEQEALAGTKEEEIRSKIIEEFGFDEIDDSEKIDKLVEREKKHHETLSKTISQKIKYRELARKPSESKPEEKPKAEPEDLDKKVNEKVLGILEQRDLESMDYSDEIKAEIKRVAQITGVSVKKAAQDPYIRAKFIEPYEKERQVDEASVSRTNKSGSSKGNYSLENPPDVDMKTEEGRKKWDSYLEDMRKKHPSSEGL